MLTLNNIVVHYGGVQALKGVSLEAAEGTITCLIGANGAGKSTTLRAISGIVPLTSGEIHFRGRRIDGLDPEEIVDMGIGHVPEGKKLFLEMSVRDNLLTGAYLRRNKKRTEDDLEKVCKFFPVLQRAINRPAAQMSGGEQQMLAIARGLMCAPRMLLLDEPSLGLSPLLTQEVGRIIKQIADDGMTILLIEQNASLALQLATSCYVLETGNVVLQGTSDELKGNDHIKAAYLGLDVTAPEPGPLAPPPQKAEAEPQAPPEAPMVEPTLAPEPPSPPTAEPAAPKRIERERPEPMPEPPAPEPSAPSAETMAEAGPEDIPATPRPPEPEIVEERPIPASVAPSLPEPGPPPGTEETPVMQEARPEPVQCAVQEERPAAAPEPPRPIPEHRPTPDYQYTTPDYLRPTNYGRSAEPSLPSPSRKKAKPMVKRVFTPKTG